MNQVFEFIGNNLLLCAAFAAVLAMVVYYEYTRLASGLKSLSPFAATKLLNGGEALFLDVRDDKDFKAGHISNAKHVPLSNMDKFMHELEKYKDKDVVIYCESGQQRSQKAGAKLRKNGFTQLHQIAGGLGEWEKANLPTVS